MQRATTETNSHNGSVRHDWTRAQALALYEAPFNDLLAAAHTVHRRHFDANAIQMSRLLSIKTGGCAEDCGYCSQSAHHKTGPQGFEADGGPARPRRGQESARCRCHAAIAWAPPGAARKSAIWTSVVAMVEGVKALGMETCMTLGMLSDDDVARLSDAGLDYYNHNIDTSESLLREGHHDAHVRRPARYAGAGARGRHQGVLGRHRRHGRGEAGSRRHAGDAGEPGRASGERADQHADPDRGHASRKAWRASTRSSSCAPSRSRAS